MSGNLDSLIAELERAAEGLRELDGEIALSLGWVKHHAGWAHWTTPDGLENRHVPFFSDSLDAALTLVPEGCGWEISVDPDWEGKIPPSAVVCPIGESPQRRILTVAPTPALALCIAALKARQAMKDAA